MRSWSSLLVATLAGFIGVAPAAPVRLAAAPPNPSTQPQQGGEDEKPEQKRHKPQPAIGRVVLRAANPRTSDTTAAIDEAAATTDAAPALRVRRLPSVPTHRAPIRELGADIRAGLLDTPPPRA